MFLSGVDLAGRVSRLLDKVVVRFCSETSIAAHFRAQGATIGDGCRILIRSLGSEPYLVTIGSETLISSDVVFSTHDGATWVARDITPELNRFGRIRVGSRSFVGARSIIMPGVTIGSRTIIGAGSVVTHDVPDGMVAAGVPARVICTVDEYLTRARASSLDLPDGVFPLEKGDRSLLRRSLELSLPGEHDE